jgi:hypothetical protein
MTTATSSDLQEPVRKRVGGSLSNIHPLKRLEMLRRNALMLRGGVWQPPQDDGTLVRKTVGKTR